MFFLCLLLIPFKSVEAAGFSKLLVGGGVIETGGIQSYSHSVEVIDLENPKTRCKPMPDNMKARDGSIATLDVAGTPIICTGFGLTTSSDCLKLSEDRSEWIEADSLTHRRRFSSGASLTEDQFLILGGEDFPVALSSTEILGNDSQWESTQFLDKISHHCMVKVDDSSILIIGGHLGKTSYSNKVFVYNITGKHFSEDENSLKTGREFHSCGMIKNGSIKNLVVVGGRNQSILNSVEIFDTIIRTWSEGPSLPISIYLSSLVEGPNGEVILVGGHTGVSSVSDLYILKDVTSAWTKMDQTLAEPRWSHVSLLIPDSLAACSVPAYSKVLVALGSRNGDADVEIIDLLSSSTTCKSIPNLPYPNSGAVGGLGPQEKPIICGGYTNSATCHYYDGIEWKVDASLNAGRSNAAISTSPFLNGFLFITGGGPSTSEVFYESGWQLSTSLPQDGISGHCMVQINSTTVMITTGSRPTIVTKTYFYNSQVGLWSDGPSLGNSVGDACSNIRRSSASIEKVVIVVGGFDKLGPISSTALVNPRDGTSSSGPPFPSGVSNPALVEDPSGGVVAIGGFYYSDGISAYIYKLEHTEAKWIKMDHELRTGRSYHTAFLIPDDLADCK